MDVRQEQAFWDVIKAFDELKIPYTIFYLNYLKSEVLL